MPCSPAKARYLLKANKATVKRRTPFTIQLSIATGETKQDVTFQWIYLSQCALARRLVVNYLRLKAEA